MERYVRQVKIAQIGVEGQEKLKKARVAVVGAGGLGCPVLTYLTAAGVGYIRCIDQDIVSLTNLNRQFLYTEMDIGKEKAASAAEKLSAMNQTVKVDTVCEKLTEENAEDLLGDMQVVIDCVDSIKTRLIINRVCLKTGIPLVEGGISGFYGFVTVVKEECACLGCLGYDHAQEVQEVPAIGAVAGVTGSLQACECLKLLLGIGDAMAGRIIQYDGLMGSFDEIPVAKRKDCTLHKEAGKE